VISWHSQHYAKRKEAGARSTGAIRKNANSTEEKGGGRKTKPAEKRRENESFLNDLVGV